MTTDIARQVADAVLYEGYVLYPYRASALKNRYRWQIGVVAPREYAEACGSDPWCMQTECLVQPGGAARLDVCVRFLQVQPRRIESRDRAGGRWRAVEAIDVAGRCLFPWEEGVVREFRLDALPLAELPYERSVRAAFPGGRDVEPVEDAPDGLAARVVRRRWPLLAAVSVRADRAGACAKIRVRIENLTRCRVRTLDRRPTAVRRALAGTHTVLAVDDGAFISLLDPPPAAAEAAASCVNLHTWPVLVGERGARNALLSAPVILPDYPAVAPESIGQFCDATEIDELLALRVATLTDAEKREARATDERACRILAEAEAASPAALRRLHGAIRRYVEVGGARVRAGSRVRLRPSRRSDSLDIALADRLGTVVDVHTTLEGQLYVTVAVDDDPAAAADPRFRRALFFHPDEIVPIDADAFRGEAS